MLKKLYIGLIFFAGILYGIATGLNVPVMAIQQGYTSSDTPIVTAGLVLAGFVLACIFSSLIFFVIRTGKRENAT